jgi:hypothetical protein
VVPADGSDGTPAVATVDPGEEDNANNQETKMLPKEEEGGVKKMVSCRSPARDVGLKCDPKSYLPLTTKCFSTDQIYYGSTTDQLVLLCPRKWRSIRRNEV